MLYLNVFTGGYLSELEERNDYRDSQRNMEGEDGFQQYQIQLEK